MNEYEELLKTLWQQEEEVKFESFTNDIALAVGMALLQEARKRDKPGAIDLTRNGQQLFDFAMAGTSIDNGEWIKPKNYVVNRFGHSSCYIGISLQNSGHTVQRQ